MKSIEELISDHPFLEGVDAASLKLMAGCARNVSFDAGRYIMNAGDAADHFYLVRRGVVALECRAPGRDPVIVETLKEGDFLGVSWLAPPYISQFDSRAVESVQAVEFDAACLRGKCEADHNLGYALMKRFVPAIMKRLHAARIQSMDIYGRPPPAEDAG